MGANPKKPESISIKKKNASTAGAPSSHRHSRVSSRKGHEFRMYAKERHRCPKCPKNFPSAQTMIDHYLKDHHHDGNEGVRAAEKATTMYEFGCEECGRKFKKRHQLW